MGQSIGQILQDNLNVVDCVPHTIAAQRTPKRLHPAHVKRLAPFTALAAQLRSMLVGMPPRERAKLLHACYKAMVDECDDDTRLIGLALYNGAAMVQAEQGSA